MRSAPFFLVWSPSGDRPPRYKHASADQAEAEAQRLAKDNPGREFFVLAPTFTVTAQKVLTERFYVDDDGIPF